MGTVRRRSAACPKLKKAFAKRYRSAMKESDAARTLELLAKLSNGASVVG